MRAPTCQKATEIRYRTPGAHPDTSFDPKEELWSFAFWLLRHRHVHNYMLIYLATTLLMKLRHLIPILLRRLAITRVASSLPQAVL